MNTSAPTFWSWFVAHEAEIRRAYVEGATSKLDELLSDRVAQATAGAGWEIGPYDPSADVLVISPGTLERVPACRELVGQAPAVPGWRFLAGKPPKVLQSIVTEIDGHEVRADAWRYRLTSYNGGEFVDIELFHQADDSPAPADGALAAELTIEHLVGEIVSLERVGTIELLCVDRVEDVERATPLRFLKPHLHQVLRPSPYGTEP